MLVSPFMKQIIVYIVNLLFEKYFRSRSVCLIYDTVSVNTAGEHTHTHTHTLTHTHAHAARKHAEEKRKRLGTV